MDALTDAMITLAADLPYLVLFLCIAGAAATGIALSAGIAFCATFVRRLRTEPQQPGRHRRAAVVDVPLPEPGEPAEVTKPQPAPADPPTIGLRTTTSHREEQ